MESIEEHSGRLRIVGRQLSGQGLRLALFLASFASLIRGLHLCLLSCHISYAIMKLFIRLILLLSVCSFFFLFLIEAVSSRKIIPSTKISPYRQPKTIKASHTKLFSTGKPIIPRLESSKSSSFIFLFQKNFLVVSAVTDLV